MQRVIVKTHVSRHRPGMAKGSLTRHASYLASWLGVLKEDKRAIFKAASMAQKAVDFIREAILKTTSEEPGEELAIAA